MTAVIFAARSTGGTSLLLEGNRDGDFDSAWRLVLHGEFESVAVEAFEARADVGDSDSG